MVHTSPFWDAGFRLHFQLEAICPANRCERKKPPEIPGVLFMLVLLNTAITGTWTNNRIRRQRSLVDVGEGSALHVIFERS